MTESFSNRTMNSASALMRFKTRSGYNRDQKVNVCGYIAMMKIRKALHTEFTDELFREFVKTNQYSKRTRVGDDKRDRINKFINRLNKLDYSIIENIYRVYQAGGIEDLVKEMGKPLDALKRTNTINLDIEDEVQDRIDRIRG